MSVIAIARATPSGVVRVGDGKYCDALETTPHVGIICATIWLVGSRFSVRSLMLRKRILACDVVVWTESRSISQCS